MYSKELRSSSELTGKREAAMVFMIFFVVTTHLVSLPMQEHIF